MDKMNNDKEWFEKMSKLDDGGCISARGEEFLPTIGVSEFAKKRHLEEHQFTHYKGSWEDLCNLTMRACMQGDFSFGYREGVILAHINKDDVKMFFSYDGFKKFEGMKITASVEKVPGREHEPAKLQVKILEPKIRCRYVDIILYNRSVLEEDGDSLVGTDWEIVSINGRFHKSQPPMDPLTMVRNWKHLPGGTEMKDSKPEDVLEQLCNAVLYKNGMKRLMSKEKSK